MRHVAFISIMITLIAIISSCGHADARGGDATVHVDLGDVIRLLEEAEARAKAAEQALEDALRGTQNSSSGQSSESAPAQTQPLTPALAPARMYLESDIFATDVNTTGTRQTHPADGSFTMRNQTFHTGITVHSWVDCQTTGTYAISELGFTSLSGVLGGGGFFGGRTVSLTITCADSGRFLGGAETTTGGALQEVNIDVSGVQRVTIMLQISGSGGIASNGQFAGFGNAFFY